MSLAAETPLKIIFLPFATPGHMLPMADLTNIFALHGVECTVITTPANASIYQTSSANPPMNIHTRLLTFQGLDFGLPPGVENFGSITSNEMAPKLFYAMLKLQKPTEDLIRELLPVDCIISDMFYPWTSDFASEIRVPRLVFQSSSIFSLCCGHSLKVHAPHEQVVNDEDLVTLPSLPHKVEMKASQLPGWVRIPNGYTHLMDSIKEAEVKSYGIIANTFSEMEKEYEEYYNKATGLKIWSLGPVSNRVNPNKEVKASSLEADCWMTCLKWLDQKDPNSILFVSFGSLTRFPNAQLQEIAAGLEASGHDFIWAVRKKDDDEDEQWSIKKFRKRMEVSNKGLIIEGWAPQRLILEHQAIRGIVTHCGWNTILEAVNSGLPLVTWPLFAEQFYNEKLVVDVLKVGVAVGACVWCNVDEPGKEIITRDKVKAAIQELMGDSKGAVEMRQRARELGKAATMAVQVGGSSQVKLMAFLDELKKKRSEAV